ncbi:MAG: prepilin peptidase [Patescibacteria group bacterium]|jgi:prepilin signal peptidase PulO-like enzyme (type II secretory pathway)
MTFLFSSFVFVFGLIIGSFLNCLIWRLYKDETLGGRSYCPKCRYTIAWYDNIPLLSFLFLKGRCRHCHEKISWQYPLVEFATAILFLLTFQMDALNPQFSWLLIRDWFLIITLIIVFVYDFRWQLVPVKVVWFMGALILVLNIILGVSWLTELFYASLGAAFFLIQYFLTKKKGIGEGDIWLGAFLGAAFPGSWLLLLIMVLSYGLGSIISLILMAAAKKKWKSRIALGPFLVSGAIITLIWGERIISWYLNLF